MFFGPVGGEYFRDLAVGHLGQARKYVPQVSKGIPAPPAAAFNDRVNDGAAFTGLGVPDKQPVLLPAGREANEFKTIQPSNIAPL